MTAVNYKLLRRLRVLSIVEGVSTIMLFFIAMPLKYLAGLPEVVTVLVDCTAHFLLFWYFSLCMQKRRFHFLLDFAALGVLCAIVPFGPFYFDRYLNNVESS